MRGYIKQSTYQAKVEEIKRLKADLKILCFSKKSEQEAILKTYEKWHRRFKIEHDFMELLKETAKRMSDKKKLKEKQ